MIVLDTHVWLWWAAAPRKLSRAAARLIEHADLIGVSSMSVFELIKLSERRRIRLDSAARDWVRDALARERVEPLSVTPEIAAEAAQLRFIGDPIDRIVRNRTGSGCATRDAGSADSRIRRRANGLVGARDGATI